MLTTYGVLFLIGIGLSVVSFVAGTDVSHGHGGIDHGFHHGGGHGFHHGADHHLTAHHGHAAGAHDGNSRMAASAAAATPKISPFNFATMTAFLAWFGGTGVVLHELTSWAELPIAAGAAATGIVGGTAVNRFLRLLIGRERPLSSTNLVGMVGTITSTVRQDGTGEMVFVLNGSRNVLAARSETGAPIEKGSEVVVIRFEKGIAYVSTWNELTASSQLS
jgi:hypothetical protein